MRAKKRIESTHAVEPTRERDLDDRQIRLGEQLFCQQQALGLGQLDRRDAELLLDHATQLPRAESQVVGQSFEVSPIVQGARFNPASGRTRRCAEPHPPERAPAPALAGTAGKVEILRAPPARSWRKTGTGRGPPFARCRSGGNRFRSRSLQRKIDRRSGHHARPGLDSKSRLRFS